MSLTKEKFLENLRKRGDASSEISLQSAVEELPLEPVVEKVTKKTKQKKTILAETQPNVGTTEQNSPPPSAVPLIPIQRNKFHPFLHDNFFF